MTHDELTQASRNGRVGSRLVSETDAVRVWTIALQPGERLPFHCHMLNYFWTATSQGQARSHYEDGRVAETTYKPGDTRHYQFAAGERMIHDLENTGTTTLTFVTVELKIGSANAALALAG
jgi:beta-alanine degradation protein BauB